MGLGQPVHDKDRTPTGRLQCDCAGGPSQSAGIGEWAWPVVLTTVSVRAPQFRLFPSPSPPPPSLMGPKPKKSAGKKKITKAERLRLLQEEEERRQKEEEEARLRFEKEEQERLEIQRKEKEKWRLLEKKDLERRNEELEELNLLEGCFPEAEKLKRETRALAQWKHYIQCDGSPDPSIAPEMNTFLSLSESWRPAMNLFAFMWLVEAETFIPT